MSPAPAAAKGGWRWKAYAVPGGPKSGFGGVSCPTTNLCVAIGQSGSNDDVFWTTKPTAGRNSWHRAALEPASQPDVGVEDGLLNGISCEKAGAHILCSLVDDFANVWNTSNPSGGKGAWEAVQIDNYGLNAISCWSAYCGELDAQGNALISLGGTVRSNEDVQHQTNGLGPGEQSISCNSSAFCAASVYDSARVWWTTSAVSDHVVWHVGKVKGGRDVRGLACPTKALCVAVLQTGGGGKPAVGVWRNPGSGSWRSAGLPSKDGPMDNVSCQSGSLCDMGGAGFGLISTHPSSGKASLWKRLSIPVGQDGVDLVCPSKLLCVAAQVNGNRVAVGRS